MMVFPQLSGKKKLKIAEDKNIRILWIWGEGYKTNITSEGHEIGIK